MKSTTAKKSRSASSSRTDGKTATQRRASTRQRRQNSQEETSEETPKNSQLEVLFMDMLRDIYGAEKKLTEALQKMCDSASTDVLQSAFEDHLFVTQKHVSRLEKVFSLLGKAAEEKTCEAMEALVKEGEKVIEQTKDGSMTRDAGLIISAQKVEHYEIAAYGSLVQVALTLGHAQVASILEKTLWEEEDTDSLLTEIAETSINPMADEEELVGEEESAEV